MDSPRDSLATALRIRFGTAPQEPSATQLDGIIRDVDAIRTAGRLPVESDWRAAVHRHCPTAGAYKYAGVDTSDLVALLVQATAKVTTK